MGVCDMWGDRPADYPTVSECFPFLPSLAPSHCNGRDTKLAKTLPAPFLPCAICCPACCSRRESVEALGHLMAWIEPLSEDAPCPLLPSEPPTPPPCPGTLTLLLLPPLNGATSVLHLPAQKLSWPLLSSLLQ